MLTLTQHSQIRSYQLIHGFTQLWLRTPNFLRDLDANCPELLLPALSAASSNASSNTSSKASTKVDPERNSGLLPKSPSEESTGIAAASSTGSTAVNATASLDRSVSSTSQTAVSSTASMTRVDSATEDTMSASNSGLDASASGSHASLGTAANGSGNTAGDTSGNGQNGTGRPEEDAGGGSGSTSGGTRWIEMSEIDLSSISQLSQVLTNVEFEFRNKHVFNANLKFRI